MISKSEAGRMGAIASQKWQKEQLENKLKLYEENPTKCEKCNKSLPYKNRRNKFCDKSCAAKLNNVKFPKRDLLPREKCKECGDSISRENHLFCSNNCRWKNKRKQLLIDMENESLKIQQHATIKKYILELYGNNCMDPECAWDHTKRPIKVELEHKDGDSHNNKLENLTLLCPNCHSLTETYKAKNKGKGRSYRRERYAEGKSY